MAALTVKARDVFFELLSANGVSKVFGNPGTTELELLRGLDGTDLEYVMALQDAAAVGLAHGYWVTSGELAVVNLHATAGVASALGNIYNAHRSKVPMLVTAGQIDRRMQPYNPPLSGDMVSIVRPISKWGWEVAHSDQLVPVVRRAISVALTPPQGVVFLSLPMDVMEEVIELPSLLTVPEPIGPTGFAEDSVRRVADLLRRATAPLVVVGEAVDRSGAGAAIDRIAHEVGAVIFNERVPPSTPVGNSGANYRGTIGFSAAQVRSNLESADLVLLAGVSKLAPIVYDQAWEYATGATIVEVVEAPELLNRTISAGVGVHGPLLEFFDQLAAALETSSPVASATEPRPRSGGDAADPLTAAAVVELVGERWPDALVFDEALTSSPAVLANYPLEPGSYHGINGTSLGWGLPAAIGAQLGAPGRRVVAFVGDGAALYCIQSLWSAAHYKIPIIVVILNNRGYEILKAGSGPLGPATRVEFDIENPTIDYQAIAKGFGVESTAVRTRGELTALLDQWDFDGPVVVEAHILKPDLVSPREAREGES